ncbi:MAG: His-Xaa-Ser system radical SAM maturase HxsC [Eubacterium sp.]|nr:His-Xaa-Ser system radical SAM maturase HxsC [Eubacterium sp.]
MGIRFDNYKYDFRIASLALKEDVKVDLLENNLSVIFVDDEQIVLYPEKIVLSNNQLDLVRIKEYNNYDVFEIWENGALVRRYNDNSNDNYFFITSGCNSNCIMCPSPDASRKLATQTSISDLMLLAKHIPKDTPHLTITGGEPFLIGTEIFEFINFLKQKFEDTEFLFLTNGRIFSVEKYVKLFRESIPNNSVVAIPIHASYDELHDSITRAKNSFQQTKLGVKNLLKNNIKVEIRLVVSKLNVDDFNNIADLIIKEFKSVAYVSVIAMEMTGNAFVNKEQVWLPYKETFSLISDAVRHMIENSIDVKLYNFPLCTVDSSFWTLCEKSISPNKIRYAPLCEDCKYKSVCGGVFAGTFKFEKDELRAIK